MKRIIVSLVLMMIGIYGIAEEIQKDVNSASYNEFLEYFKTDLEAFSHRFSDFDSISEELIYYLTVNIFSLDMMLAFTKRLETARGQVGDILLNEENYE